jgi:hypothetical protein
MIHRRLFLACLLVLSTFPFFAHRLQAQAAPPATAVVMVQIQCQPGTADLWREAFEKEEVPVIRELVQKGDLYTGFTYFESPLPAQDIDFVLLFEVKSFALFDVRRPFPHWDALLRRMGPERFQAYEKLAGEREKTVRVSILRSFRVQ